MADTNYTTQTVIDSWFKTGDFPTEAQFKAAWRSFWHKSEKIPMSSIEGLNLQFQQTATITMLGGYAKRDATNLDMDNVAKWQEKLEVTKKINITGKTLAEIHEIL